MFCSVSFSFHSNRKPLRKNLVYKVEGISLKSGDIVEVDYKGIPHIVVVKHVFETDDYNYQEMVRININKKLHTNTVNAAIRKRFNEFKDIRVQTERVKGKRLEKRIIKILGEDYRRRILKYICLGNIQFENDVFIGFNYANNLVILSKNKHGQYIIVGFQKYKQSDFKAKWYTPKKVKDYYDRLYNDHYAKNIAI